MTVSTTTLYARYNGNGSTTEFSTGFSFTSNSEVKVTLYNAAGVGTVKTITTHYTVTGAGTGNAGTVTMLTAPASGEVLYIELNVPLTQTYDYQNNSKFPNETTEAAFDKAIRIAQMQQSQIDRVLKVSGASNISDIELPAPEAGKAIGGNATNDGYINLDLTSLGTVSLLDEDDMASNSAVSVPTQQSVKAYVDALSADAVVGQPTLISSTSLTSITDATATSGIDTSGYDYIKIRVVDFTATDNLFIQTSADNSTWKTAATDYKVGSSNSTGFSVSGDLSTRRQYCDILIQNLNDATKISACNSEYVSVETNGSNAAKASATSCRQAATSDRYIRFILDGSGESCSSGTAYVYGVNHD